MLSSAYLYDQIELQQGQVMLVLSTSHTSTHFLQISCLHVSTGQTIFFLRTDVNVSAQIEHSILVEVVVNYYQCDKISSVGYSII